MTLEMFYEQLQEMKYGNDTALNVVMSMFLLRCNNLSQDFFEKVFTDNEELEDFLFLVPQSPQYETLTKRVVAGLFGSRGFYKLFIKKFLRHFSGSPKIVNYYLNLERNRINKFNHGAFA